MTVTSPVTLRYYKITLYFRSEGGKKRQVKYRDEGKASPPNMLFVDGFSRDQVIELGHYYSAMIRECMT